MKRRRDPVYDVIVVGGGHAGCEAAAAASRMGATVALITMSRKNIGVMSCNPSIGGVGKGHLVREIDACDGIMARAADAAAIHYRMLNASKGVAVHGPRVQADRARYGEAVLAALTAQNSLHVIEGHVDRLTLEEGVVTGVMMADGHSITSRATIITTGTFLGARTFSGEMTAPGGRIGEPPAIGLALQLKALGLPIARLKTGTPPRLDGRTIDWASLEPQPSDGSAWTMSALGSRVLPQVACALTRTTEASHAIVRASLSKSAVFSGAITGRGPRYCPSIEDKIVRFADRASHQIFLEPESLENPTIYPNGISTSLPPDVQLALVRSLPGLSEATIVQPGYAVEYDHVDPRCLDHGLRVRTFPGLYLAGQVNGTTGYEEAAAQGLVAGAMAASDVGNLPAPVFDRQSSYIGVMIDDLVLQGVTEPYRMLTSRAEFRLKLRSDNASTRLGQMADSAGLLTPQRSTSMRRRHDDRQRALHLLEQTASASQLREHGATVQEDGSQSLYDWLRRDTVLWKNVCGVEPGLAELPQLITDEVSADALYGPYVSRQERETARLSVGESVKLGDNFAYDRIKGLSTEMRERLAAARPRTLGEAARVRGITPAALTALMIEARSSS